MFTFAASAVTKTPKYDDTDTYALNNGQATSDLEQILTDVALAGILRDLTGATDACYFVLDVLDDDGRCVDYFLVDGPQDLERAHESIQRLYG